MNDQRAALMAPILRQFKRRFSVLDLGAGIYLPIAKELLEEFDCCYVAVEKDELRTLVGHDLIWLHCEMDAHLLERLLQRCYFDVIIACNVLHWRTDWMEWLIRMAGVYHLFVQLPCDTETTAPGAEDRRELQATVARLCRPLGNALQHEGQPPRPMWWRHRPESKYKPLSHGCRIHPTYERCWATCEKWTKEWIQGINLRTYIEYNGQYPLRQNIYQLVKEFTLPPTNHGDFVIHNLIYDGRRLHLVDGFEGWEFRDAEVKKATLKKLWEELCLG